MIDTRRGPLLDHLEELETRCESGDITLQEIVDVFGADGHYVLIAFLIIPFLQPIPLLGLSTPFGVLIALIAVMAYLKRPPRLPKRWANLKVSAKTVKRIASASETAFDKATFFSHPRHPIFFRGIFRHLNMGVLALNAILLALPLPIPFSNAIPAWVVAVQAIAQLEEDGIFVWVSYVQTVACLGYFALIAKAAGMVAIRFLT